MAIAPPSPRNKASVYFATKNHTKHRLIDETKPLILVAVEEN